MNFYSTSTPGVHQPIIDYFFLFRDPRSLPCVRHFQFWLNDLIDLFLYTAEFLFIIISYWLTLCFQEVSSPGSKSFCIFTDFWQILIVYSKLCNFTYSSLVFWHSCIMHIAHGVTIKGKFLLLISWLWGSMWPLVFNRMITLLLKVSSHWVSVGVYRHIIHRVQKIVKIVFGITVSNFHHLW